MKLDKTVTYPSLEGYPLWEHLFILNLPIDFGRRTRSEINTDHILFQGVLSPYFVVGLKMEGPKPEPHVSQGFSYASAHPCPIRGRGGFHGTRAKPLKFRS